MCVFLPFKSSLHILLLHKNSLIILSQLENKTLSRKFKELSQSYRKLDSLVPVEQAISVENVLSLHNFQLNKLRHK